MSTELIEQIEKSLELNKNGVVAGIQDALLVKVKKDYKVFSGLSKSDHWDITPETIAGRVWFRTYNREIGEALYNIPLGSKVSTNLLITKVNEPHPKYNTRMMFAKLLTKELKDVIIVKNEEEKQVSAIGEPTVNL